MTIFTRLQQASYCKNRLAENGKHIHGDDTNLLNMFEAAQRQSDNLNIHTRNSLRASTPVLNCNDAQLSYLVSHCLEPKSDIVKMSDFKMSDAKSAYRELFTSLEEAEAIFWPKGYRPVTEKLRGEDRFLVINTGKPVEQGYGMLGFASVLNNTFNKLQNMCDVSDEEVELALGFKEAFTGLVFHHTFLPTQTVPYASVEQTIEENSKGHHLSVYGTKEHACELVKQMGDIRSSWLNEYEQEHGEVLLRGYTHNNQWDLAMMMTYTQNPILAFDDGDKLEQFKFADEHIILYEQTILKNLHPAHLSFLKTINPESVGYEHEKITEYYGRALEKSFVAASDKWLKRFKKKRQYGDIAAYDFVAKTLVKHPLEMVSTLFAAADCVEGLQQYIILRLVSFHSLLANSLKALIFLSTETLLDSHDPNVVKSSRDEQKPSYRKMTGQRAKVRRKLGSEPREIIASPALTIVDYRVTGLERRRNADLSLHKDNSGIRGTHTKSRHYVRPHYALLKEKVLKSGEISPARTIYKSGHFRGERQSTRVRRIR